MGDQNSAPANQDTPQEDKLYGGKYKTPEELEAAYLEAERKTSQLYEENDRMSRYISLMDQPQPAQAPANVEPDATGYAPHGEEIPESWRSYVKSELDSRENRIRTAQEIERKFFEDNPDLVGFEDLVVFHATKVRSEPASRRMTVEDVAKETAKRVRVQMEAIRRGDRPVPPHVQSGSSGERAPKSQPEPVLTEEQRLQAYLNETRGRKHKMQPRG